jgi:uncharacterized membrane protein
MFWMNGCPACHEVLDHVLLPIQAKYGAQFEIRLVEILTVEDFDRLREVAAGFGIPKERAGVPFLIIGDLVLIGPGQIQTELPVLIEQYLTQGGVDWPQGLAPQPAKATLPLGTSVSAAPGVVVRAILFTTSDCHSCQIETVAALNPILTQYGEQFEYRTIDIVTSEDVEYLYRVTASYEIPREQVDLPLLIIGNRMLIGEAIVADLPRLVASSLAAGGVDWPAIPALPGATPSPLETPLSQPDVERPDGFTLAIVVMICMVAALLYSLIAFLSGKTWKPAPWMDWLTPALVIVGIGVAGYLAYVETQSVTAICGPVGDCNTVQSSPYARLFGVLPLGVLGLVGYVLILAAWLFKRKSVAIFINAEKVSTGSAFALFGMAFGGTLFSLYLTYLELFVIRAICAWCLASAALMALILLFNLNVNVQQLKIGGHLESQNEP